MYTYVYMSEGVWLGTDLQSPLVDELVPGQMRSNQRVQNRFRGGLAFKAHRICVSLSSRFESIKEEERNRATFSSKFSTPPD